MTDIANPHGSPFSASTPLDLSLTSESEHPTSKHLFTHPDQLPLSVPRATQNPRQQPRKDGSISLGREETQVQKALQVIGSCFMYMNSWGILNSFGAFQAYYAQALRPSKSESQIAWIGSLQGFLLLFIGVLVGPAIDAGYMRHVLTIGSFLFAFGLFMTSLCHQYYQLILAQGLVVGIGAGCIFLPSITIVPQWFSPQRSPLALGIVATGSSIGGIIFPAMFHSIQMSADFGWAVRVIAFVTLATNVFGTAVLKYQAPLPEHHRALLDMSMLKERYFLPLCAALWLALAGLYIPIFFIPSYYLSISPSTSQGSSSATLAFWLVPILMAGSLPGRLVPNMLAASFIGNHNMVILMTLLSSILAFCWIAVGDGGAAGLIIFALLYGFTSGGLVSLIPPVVVSTAPSKQNLGTRMGMALTVASLGVLVGCPVAGAILTNSPSESYTYVQVFAGVVLMLSVVVFLIVKALKLETGSRLGWWESARTRL